MNAMQNALSHKNAVFIGEAGSGKSELSLNWCYHLHRYSSRPVHLFDLDQTKPIFRTRELQAPLKKEGIILHFYDQLLDAPVTAEGVSECLYSSADHAVLDIGGNAGGVRMLGQFSKDILSTDTIIYFVINPFRPWSDSEKHIKETLDTFRYITGLKDFHFVSNPNLGPQSTLEDFLSGHSALLDMLAPDCTPDFAMVEETLFERAAEELSIPLVPIQRNFGSDYLCWM